MSKVFIDTNILVYTLNSTDSYKQTKAREIMEKVVDFHQPVISTQVLKEFYVVATTKLKADRIIVKNIIHNFCNIEIVQNDLELIEQAIDISVISQLSFWDSLIIAAAEKAKCEFIISEDLNPGQTYRGVMVINPFKEDVF
ncbi:PIN domain-containing protein [Treponema socranskii]|uniref:PIN domain-containing protein n=1 Tax=Treponema socranskii TaxID=53419 RepID=UPI0020A3444E|nr:PIN domain-containing protein [Treponema socranskii]